MFGYFSNFDNDLFDQLERMRRDMDLLVTGRSGTTGIRSVAAGTYPAINIGGSADRVDVYVFAAGLDPKTVDLSIQQNLLSLAGERQLDQPEGAQFYRRERFSGAFRRVLTLPDDVDSEKVTASYRDGVLHITVPRREAVKPRQIEVK